MNDWREAQQGGFVTLSDEAMPAASSSTQIFANAPALTRRIILTIRAQALTIRFSGSAATAGANGHTFAIGTHVLYLNQETAKLVRAIQEAATATGYITYQGVRSA